MEICFLEILFLYNLVYLGRTRIHLLSNNFLYFIYYPIYIAKLTKVKGISITYTKFPYLHFMSVPKLEKRGYVLPGDFTKYRGVGFLNVNFTKIVFINFKLNNDQ